MKKSYYLNYNKIKECEILILMMISNFEHFSKWNIAFVTTLTWPSVGVKPNTWKS
jgi:hypothetical protein